MICAIVLAAGYSSRMGTQKLLLPIGQGTVISHIVNQLIKSKVIKTYVVVGHQADQVTKELSDLPVTIIHNPEYKSGMLSSVRAGLLNIPDKCEAVFVVLGDQPSISSAIIDEMIRLFSIKEKKIIVPVFNGNRGHPVLLSTIYKDEILKNFNDIGLRGILQVHDSDLYEMSVSDSSVLMDMDYPRDYQREAEKYKQG